MKSGIISAAFAAVAFTNAAKRTLIPRKVRKIDEAFRPKRRISQSDTRLTSCVYTKALARTNAETFNQITGSPKVAIAGFAFKIPVSTRPQIKSIEVT